MVQLAQKPTFCFRDIVSNLQLNSIILEDSYGSLSSRYTDTCTNSQEYICDPKTDHFDNVGSTILDRVGSPVWFEISKVYIHHFFGQSGFQFKVSSTSNFLYSDLRFNLRKSSEPAS